MQPTTRPTSPPVRRWLLLPPAVRRLWRDERTLQLGRGAPGAVVLEGLDPSARAVLALLDGTRTPEALLRDAAASGCSPARTTELVEALSEAGLLEDAADRVTADLGDDEQVRLAPDLGSLALVAGDGGALPLRRRLDACVRVVGAGRVGAAVATLLASAGVGAVDVVDGGAARLADVAPGGLLPADEGRRRDEALVERIECLSPRVGLGSGRRPDLVVLAPVAAAALDGDLAGVPEGVPHLLAEVRDAVGVVGPFVVPGHTACLRCLDLERTDRDPQWPVLAAQLATPQRAVAPCDSVLAAAVAAQAALQVLALVDGPAPVRPGRAPAGWPPASVGGTLELALPDWRWRRRAWPQHADCGCRLAS